MRSLLFIISFLISFGGKAQIIFPDLESCLKYAETNAPQLQKSALETQIAEKQMDITKGALLPQVNAFATFDDYFSLPVQLIPAEFLGGNEGEFRKIQFGTPYNLSAGVEVTMPVISASRWSSIHSAGIYKDMVEAKTNATRQNLELQVAHGYYMIMLSKAAVELAEKTYQSNDSLFQSAQVKIDNGVIEPIEFNRIKSIYLDSRNNLADNRKILENNLSAFKILLGIAPEKMIALSEHITTDDFIFADVPKFEITSSPLYEFHELDVLRHQVLIKNQKLNRLPELSVYGRYTTQAQRQELNFLEKGEPWFDIGVVGLKLNFPIFTGFQRSNSIQIAMLNLESAKLDQQDFINREGNENEILLRNYEQSRLSVETYRELLELNTENYEIALYKFKAGAISIDQLMNIYKENILAQNQYLAKMADLMIQQSTIIIKSNALNK